MIDYAHLHISFIHMTMSEPPAPYWGNIVKFNSDGTLFVLSIEHVNRDTRGYVDFENLLAWMALHSPTLFPTLRTQHEMAE